MRARAAASTKIPAEAPLFIPLIVLLAAAMTLVDATLGAISLRKLSIGLAMLCMGMTFRLEPKRCPVVARLRRIGAVLAVGYFVLWALE